MALAPKNITYDVEIPDSKMYSVPLFETKSNTMDEIPLAFFTLKISRPITISQYKVSKKYSFTYFDTIWYIYIFDVILG